jgi:leucyl aminopeptidase
MKKGFTTMIENFGLLDGTVHGNEIYLMSADEYTNWLAKASNAQQAWVTAQGFTAKPGKAITFAAVDGQIDFAIGIYGGHAVWDGALIAANLPIGQWQFVCHNNDLSNQSLEFLALGWGLGQYRFHHYRATPLAPINCLAIPTGVHTRRLLGQLRGIYLCRDLINQPPNRMTPAAIEEAMVSLAKSYKAIMKTHSGKKLESGFPAIHTVGRAAEIKPRLMDLRWGTTGPKITLIGKGITFDSGGLDLKPSKAMEMMKKDMGGAATVLGLAAAIMESGLDIQLRVLVAAAENAVSDRSMRPLDIIDTRADIKVEVGNTDAEGRLVLSDAITHALEDTPDFMIDFATLTGAARVALGTELPALFCNHDQTANAIIQAAATQQDPLWRLPLFDDYERHLDAGYAALSSTGLSSYGGAITAALFLRRFAGKSSNWAHIDVMAWNLASRPGRPKGGEAMGLRALYAFIESFKKP